ncbi:MAG TPA: hypothetical protein VM166_02730 [Gemmatimonadaceae bacterium]|nr:hypothetical protein [Gemmatimonadaceae bacterium]
MIPDIRFEADVLRAALLLGLIREREVSAWAETLLQTATESVGLLADVVVAPPELTTVREALRPIAEPSQPMLLGRVLLAWLASDPVATALTMSDRIRVLGQLRREDLLAPAIADTIKSFEDRWMLASAGVQADSTLGRELESWLATVHGPTYYRVLLEPDEQAAFLGALSRKVVRDRRVQQSARGSSCAWGVDASSGAGRALVLNQALWRVAVDEFSPLPLGSRIPYVDVPARAVVVLDERTAEPMGAAEAAHRLAAV